MKQIKSKKLIKGDQIKIIMYSIYKQDDNTITHQKNRCMCFKNDGRIQHRCPKLVISGSDFCGDHQNCARTLRKYTSGYEPLYKPTDWTHPYVESSHNCYSYFLDDKDEAIKEKCNELCLKNNSSGCPK